MPAEEAYVLSPRDVRNIRSYVQHKYAAMPQEKRAEIVADAVNRIIHKQLPNFTDNIKRSITSILIRTAVMEHQRPVRADDIFGACLDMDRSNAAIYDPFHEWMEEQLRISCEKTVMRRLLDKLADNEQFSAGDGRSRWGDLESLLKAEGIQVLGDAIPLTSAEIIPLSAPPQTGFIRRLRARAFMYSILCLFLIGASLLYGWSLTKPAPQVLQPPAAVKPVQPIVMPVDGLPAELRFHNIDESKLKHFLDTKSSILADKPYFDAIVAAAQQFDIHPALLFAITGQEQAFVPKTNKQHLQIANNPFNVFHSWQEFNTTIEQSAEIAARTVFNLSKDRPADTDPFTWINRKYAEDPKWSDGVRSIFTAIIKEIK